MLMKEEERGLLQPRRAGERDQRHETREETRRERRGRCLTATKARTGAITCLCEQRRGRSVMRHPYRFAAVKFKELLHFPFPRSLTLATSPVRCIEAATLLLFARVLPSAPANASDFRNDGVADVAGVERRRWRYRRERKKRCFSAAARRTSASRALRVCHQVVAGVADVEVRRERGAERRRRPSN
jgi:hypothetical protein